MTYNIIGYLFFGIIMYFVIFHLGQTFHKNGRVYMLKLFKKDAHLVDSINNLLLLGYYLLNLGYVSLSIIYWPQIQSPEDLIVCTSANAGRMILMLGIIHYCNMFGLVVYSHFRHQESSKSINA